MKKLFLIFFGVFGIVTSVQAMGGLREIIEQSTAQTIKKSENMRVIQAMHILSKAEVLDDIINFTQNHFFKNQDSLVVMQNESLAQNFHDVYYGQAMGKFSQECEESISSRMMNMLCDPIKKQQFQEQYLQQTMEIGCQGVKFIHSDTIKKAYVDDNQEIIAAHFLFTPWFIVKCRQLYAWMKSVRPQLSGVNQVDNRVCLLILHAALGDCLTLCDHAIGLLHRKNHITPPEVNKMKELILCFGVMLSMGYYPPELQTFAPGFVAAKRNLKKCPENYLKNNEYKLTKQYILLKDAYEYVFMLAINRFIEAH